MPDEIELRLSGRRFAGWKEITVEASIDQVARRFSFLASERAPSEPLARGIREGEACEVRVGDDLVVTGYVDDVATRFDRESHEISVSGRSRTADLVDCAALNAPGEWSRLPLERVASEIARPFAIDVVTEVSTGASLAKHKLEPGETAFSAIDRAARQRAVLLVDDAKGRLVLTRASTERGPEDLRQGVNVLAGSAELSNRERFSQYRVIGQAPTSNTLTIDQAVSVRGEATDPEVERYRPTVVISEEAGGAAQMRDRARWEASVRAGQSRRVSVTVQGWRAKNGKLWEPNRRAFVDIPWLAVRRELLVASVEYQLNAQGRTAVLSLVLPEAFELRELKPKTKKGSAAGTFIETELFG